MVCLLECGWLQCMSVAAGCLSLRPGDERRPLGAAALRSAASGVARAGRSRRIGPAPRRAGGGMGGNTPGSRGRRASVTSRPAWPWPRQRAANRLLSVARREGSAVAARTRARGRAGPRVARLARRRGRLGWCSWRRGEVASRRGRGPQLPIGADVGRESGSCGQHEKRNGDDPGRHVIPPDGFARTRLHPPRQALSPRNAGTSSIFGSRPRNRGDHGVTASATRASAGSSR